MATVVSNKARRIFTPLNISVSVVCATPDSPFMQTLSGNKYAPDRTQDGYECKARPVINATTKDGSWDNKQSNLALAQVVWYATHNGQWTPLSSIDEWTGKWSVDSSNTTSRGTLTITRNLGSNEAQQLRFVGVLYDHRTNTNYTIESDPITLYTADKGADDYVMSITEDTDISYNPFLDKLALYDYKVANGLVAASAEARSACFDDNEYERHIPVEVYRANELMKDGYSIELYRNGARLLPSSADAPNEIISVSAKEIVIDLRLVEKSDYTAKVMVGGKSVTQFQFSASRVYAPISQPIFTVCSDIDWGKIMRANKAVVMYNGNVVEYPNRLVELQWSTLAKYGNVSTEKAWQEGERCVYRIDETGLGNTDSDYIEERIAYELRSANDHISDESGALLLDESGALLID